MSKTFRYVSWAGVFALALGLAGWQSAPLQAQDTDDDTVIEEIQVTGSYIKRASFDSSSPLSILDADDIDMTGYQTISDILSQLTFTGGMNATETEFGGTGGGGNGAATLNLRGLGFNSTLVLINGRRHTVAPALLDDGSQPVNANALMPNIMIQRIEILKDGGAALYGTDAVAGVVNFIPRTQFVGAEIRASYQSITENGGFGEQEDISVSGLFGIRGERGGIVMGLSFFDRTPLPLSNTSFGAINTVSSFSFPGGFTLAPGAVDDLPEGSPFASVVIPPGQTFLHPLCGQEGTDSVAANITATIDDPEVSDIPIRVGNCSFNFAASGEWFLITKSNRLNFYTTADWQVNNHMQFFMEVGFARLNNTTGGSPSFADLNFPLIPAANPGNLLGVDLIFRGRVFGPADGKTEAKLAQDIYRVVAGFRGNFSEASNWTWEAAFNFSSHSRFNTGLEQLVIDRFNLALRGFGGRGCDPLTETAGSVADGCLFFDPWAGRTGNDPDLIQWINSQELERRFRQLITIDTLVTGNLGIDLPGGNVGVAAGFQFRKERERFNSDHVNNSLSQAFFFGDPDFEVDNGIYAVFGEVLIPILENLEFQAAVRFEDFGDLDTTDPKFGLLYQPYDNLSIRASFGTSFRAPSLFNIAGELGATANIFDPVFGTRGRIAIRRKGNPDLVPETADVYNIGVTWKPIEGANISVDYWRFEFDNLIAAEDAQQVVNADPNGPQVIRNAITGVLTTVESTLANVNQVETDGLDISASYAFDIENVGFFNLRTDWTWYNKFEISGLGVNLVDVVGSRNQTNFVQPVLEWRGNTSVSWSRGRHNLIGTVRYLDSFINDERGLDKKIPTHITLDLQYSISIPNLLVKDGDEAVLTVGSINLFDNDPPFVDTQNGIDALVHDGRGRLVYFRIIQPLN